MLTVGEGASVRADPYLHDPGEPGDGDQVRAERPGQVLDSAAP
jgi:hypothetical protein